jgi:hypothetical protein
MFLRHRRHARMKLRALNVFCRADRHGRRTVVRRVTRTEISTRQILFIGANAFARPRALRHALSKAHLAVTEIENGIDGGAVINSSKWIETCVSKFTERGGSAALESTRHTSVAARVERLRRARSTVSMVMGTDSAPTAHQYS